MSSEGQSNIILLGKLLNLSRIVVFSALPPVLHLEYMNYMGDILRHPYRPGDPIPTPVPYPTFLVYLVIAVILIDLILLLKWSNRREEYEVYTSFMFLIELTMLLWTNRELYWIPLTPVMEKIILLLGVLLFGLPQMLVIAKMRFMTKKTTSAE